MASQYEPGADDNPDNPFALTFPDNFLDEEEYTWEIWNCFKPNDDPFMNRDMLEHYLKTVYDGLQEDIPRMVQNFSRVLAERLPEVPANPHVVLLSEHYPKSNKKQGRTTSRKKATKQQEPGTLLGGLDAKALEAFKKQFPFRIVVEQCMEALADERGRVSREAFSDIHQVVQRVLLQPATTSVAKILETTQLKHFYQPKKMRIYLSKDEIEGRQ